MFKKETVVITGGTSGIGYRVAERLDEAGAHCVLIGRDASWMTGTVMNVDGGVMAGRN